MNRLNMKIIQKYQENYSTMYVLLNQDAAIGGKRSSSLYFTYLLYVGNILVLANNCCMYFCYEVKQSEFFRILFCYYTNKNVAQLVSIF